MPIKKSFVEKRIQIVLLCTFPFFLTGCQNVSESTETESPVTENQDAALSDQEEEDSVQTLENEGDDILVAYFSRADENYNVGYIEKGNTQIVAEEIASLLDADLFQIETVESYPEDYRQTTDLASEQKENNERPELVSLPDLSEYEVIFLGYPIWWGDLPMPVYTFLENSDLSGKVIIPFNTHEGSGSAGTVQTLQELLEDSEVSDNNLVIRGSIAQNDRDQTQQLVRQWLEETGFIS